MIVGGETDGRSARTHRPPYPGVVLSLFVKQTLRHLGLDERKKDLDELHVLLEAGKVTPVVDRTFPIGDAPAAITYLREGSAATISSSRINAAPSSSFRTLSAETGPWKGERRVERCPGSRAPVWIAVKSTPSGSWATDFRPSSTAPLRGHSDRATTTRALQRSSVSLKTIRNSLSSIFTKPR